jgi:DNA repair protein RadC
VKQRKCDIYSTVLDENKHCYLKLEDSLIYEEDDNAKHNPEWIARMMMEIFDMDKKADEYIYLLCYSGEHLNGIFELAHGGGNFCSISRREIYMKSLLCNANTFIIVHNHPSGSKTPSSADIKFTRDIKDGADILGMGLLDSIIITSDRTYTSFVEKGLL